MNRIPKVVYTKEFREEAVKLALTEGVGVSEAARRLSIPMKSLANGVYAAKAGRLAKADATELPRASDVPAAGCGDQRLLRVAEAATVVTYPTGTSFGSRDPRRAPAHA